MKNGKVRILVVGAAVACLFLLAAYLARRRDEPALPPEEYWEKFRLAGPVTRSPWFDTFVIDEWRFTAADGRVLEVGLQQGSEEETSWIYSDWLARTRSLTMASVDPYFPGITKAGECAPEFVPKIIAEEPGKDVIFQAAAGKSLTPGACTAQQARFLLYRRIHKCKGDGPATRLNVIDLFVPIADKTAGPVDALKSLPCLTPTGSP